MAGPRLEPGTSRSKDLLPAPSAPSPPHPCLLRLQPPALGALPGAARSPHPAPGSTEPHPGGSPVSSPLPSPLLFLKAIPEPHCQLQPVLGSPRPLPAHPNAGGPVLRGPFHTPTSSVTVPKLPFCSSQARRFTVPSSLLRHGLFLPLTLLLVAALPCCSLLQTPR